jgi:hypothetical protein
MERKETYIDTVKWPRTIEALFEIFFKLLGLYLVYKFGSYVMESEGAADTLFSILLLPALLILKDAHIILEPFTIKTYITDKDVTVKSGLLTRTTDRLSIKTLENIELVKTPVGRIGNRFWSKYGTLYLHAYGGMVIMPFLKEPEETQKRIEGILSKSKNEIKDAPP